MSNENETVEQVCEKLRMFKDCDGDYVREIEDLADDIEVAHKRELAAKDDARLTVVANYEAVIAAKERIIAAEDAEIARLRSIVRELADALKKIDDACDGDMCKHFIDTEQCSKCKYLETCQTGIAHNALKTNESEIAKALEVCHA